MSDTTTSIYVFHVGYYICGLLKIARNITKLIEFSFGEDDNKKQHKNTNYLYQNVMELFPKRQVSVIII